ncbi:hypothetical protein E4T38_01386 [Aureobasidium subglaciale]|nr:hypothetical protein E4T38_01386 [Aureobasidium subglaciale]KAI5229634.1 hypothetical protein E4T40_01387 [Aureobasidium subglaciale]KAI5233387.1 hypothetical protein E4T41_01384 [Aureobasidium subglaciale]KAI5266614.1 hypothetical protein E4T46_01386 [Aureobasidium subglaciale]
MPQTNTIKLLLCSSVLYTTTQGHGQSTLAAGGPLWSISRDWSAAINKADEFVRNLTLAEKVSMVTGNLTAGSCIGNIAPIDRVGFTGLCVQDGPLGIRTADLASVFPAGLTIAASWDPDLMYSRGFALGEEFRGKGAHVYLGDHSPSSGAIGRHPLGGRNWEGFGPDPHLNAIATQQTILGVQDAGVQACVKHYVGNEQETQRSNTETSNGTNILALSANIDDRTMHELYLWPFAQAIRSGVASVMCAYNRVNQTYTCENGPLLNDLLREELGFQGYVMSDFFAVHSGLESATAGLDMNMPGPLSQLNSESYFGKNLANLVANGSYPLEKLDDMVRRIMIPYFHLGQDQGYPSTDPTSLALLGASYGYHIVLNTTARDVRSNHSALIRKIAAEGTILLKNEDDVLPLDKPSVIGVFGNGATDPTSLYNAGSSASENGALLVGGGSGTGRATYVVSPLEALKTRAKADGSRIVWLTDNDALAASEPTSVYPTPDICLIFLKTFASEGVDRTSFEADWNSTMVVNNVASFCPKTVVILNSGGVNTMPWANNTKVQGILSAHYPGQEMGNSIVDVLYGLVNPSGRLPYTIPQNEEDSGPSIVNITGPFMNNSNAWQDDYTDGLLVDYRRYDALNITPLYEFGYGLSYTSFSLAPNVSITKLQQVISAKPIDQAVKPGGNPDLYTPLLSVRADVQNTGKVNGAAIPQLYVSLPQNSVPLGTPIRMLRSFKKIPLEFGQQVTVESLLSRKDLSFWDVESQNWIVPAGQITIEVGFSSRDLRAVGTVELL